MLYYFVPGTSIFGGIKVAYQFVDALNALGVPAVIASPGASAATWFLSHAAVVDSEEVRKTFRPEDIAVFSLPHDYPSLRTLPGQLVFHCQGTDPLIDPILADPAVKVLTCWRQAAEYVKARGVHDPLDVGISISSCFAYTGEPKFEYAVACMPRRGAELGEAVRRAYPAMRYVVIDGMREGEVARVLKHSSIFLATATHEWFGLPALEAMSAGCVVVSTPVLGGMEYLEDGINCRVAEPQDFTAAVGELLQERSAVSRFQMRQAAIATARRYTTECMMQRLSEGLDGPLSSWRRRA
ncbi:glycosyltransferase [Holophaga foetida]|uniref:glycosyltransferase n=1 Tax=Holophaga foetida TaxID=35839 RepID=UPI00047BA2B7|nr:glycosyltransferase [Holophaga foetida]